MAFSLPECLFCTAFLNIASHLYTVTFCNFCFQYNCCCRTKLEKIKHLAFQKLSDLVFGVAMLSTNFRTFEELLNSAC